LKVLEPEPVHPDNQCRLFLELEDTENIAAFRLDKDFQFRQIDGIITDIVFAHSPKPRIGIISYIPFINANHLEFSISTCREQRWALGVHNQGGR
jgi:hypothetical protein